MTFGRGSEGEVGGAVKRGSSTGRGAGNGGGGVNAACAGRAVDTAGGADGSMAAMAGGGSGAFRFRAMMMKAASPLMVKPRARPIRFATQARMLTAWRRSIAELLQGGLVTAWGWAAKWTARGGRQPSGGTPPNPLPQGEGEV